MSNFGKGGDIPANRRDEQELSVLCLRVLQAAVVYVNTLVVQDVLGEGLVELAPADRRGLTPLFWSNIAPYGEVRLNMNNRLTLREPGSYEGDDDLDDDTAIRRWTTVALYPDELGWLREALALNADTTQDDDDDGLENR